MTELFRVPGPWAGHLAISTRPRGGDWLEDEIRGWRNAGIDVVVSLLESDEATDLELSNEGELADRQGIRYISFPIADRGVPASLPAAANLLLDLFRSLVAGKAITVHCRQGIGRSGLVAAGVLVTAGIDPSVALATVQTARMAPVPDTPEQRSWIETALAEHVALARR